MTPQYFLRLLVDVERVLRAAPRPLSVKEVDDALRSRKRVHPKYLRTAEPSERLHKACLRALEKLGVVIVQAGDQCEPLFEANRNWSVSSLPMSEDELSATTFRTDPIVTNDQRNRGSGDGGGGGQDGGSPGEFGPGDGLREVLAHPRLFALSDEGLKALLDGLFGKEKS